MLGVREGVGEGVPLSISAQSVCPPPLLNPMLLA